MNRSGSLTPSLFTLHSSLVRRAGDTARRLGDDLANLVRLTRDLPAFSRTPVEVGAEARRVRERLETRAERFLAVADRSVYAAPTSPYRKLLRAAGCERGDLRALVERDGLQGALGSLAARGVYVTYDEMKGRADAVRGSARFRFAEREFDSSLVRSHLSLPTGGTGGRPSQVGRSLPLAVELAGAVALALDAHGLADVRHAMWHPTPFNWLLIVAKLGRPAIAWFYPLAPMPLKVRLGGRYLALLDRVIRSPFPPPRYLDLRRPDRLAAWLHARARDGGPVALWCFSSGAARVAAAALEDDVTLDGVTFVVQGEPFTEARRRLVEGAGARALVRYGSMEVPTAGLSCATPAAADDVHLFSDRYVLTRRARPVGEAGVSVDALLLTSLSANAPKVLLNAETGDCAGVEERPCGCRLGSLGLTTHLREIRSFEKLTGEGMTFAASSLVEVVEERLPARFGGTGLDYQLVEEERAGGTTRLILRINPTIGPLDEAAVRATLLEELGRNDPVERYMAELWQRAGTVEVVRQPPLATRAGKILPFHLARAGRVETAERTA